MSKPDDTAGMKVMRTTGGGDVVEVTVCGYVWGSWRHDATVIAICIAPDGALVQVPLHELSKPSAQIGE